ncbi:hypothetical protein HJG60_008969 [Phyllostomus discolor]|uniref:Uncharacterized protein n=1 Tax=Phyllostomus discolor TaxID=89673 RepID=A0A834DJ48_9CHIR|nr:hypothetical protein HJG60_008969 [Phyllostomus discolor]
MQVGRKRLDPQLRRFPARGCRHEGRRLRFIRSENSFLAKEGTYASSSAPWRQSPPASAPGSWELQEARGREGRAEGTSAGVFLAWEAGAPRLWAWGQTVRGPVGLTPWREQPCTAAQSTGPISLLVLFAASAGRALGPVSFANRPRSKPHS